MDDERKRDLPPLAHAAETGRRIVSASAMSLQYTDDELEFLKAIEKYKRDHNRPHPTWHEVLAVLKSLGYEKK